MDQFYFILQQLVRKEEYSKREVLSIISNLFDPAGWLGPVMIKAKLLMPKIWLQKSDWDGKLNADDLSEWINFLKGLSHVTYIQIP